MTYAPQARAIAEALELSEPDGVVHVYGPKEDGAPLSQTERTCEQPDAGQRVVFHALSVQLTAGARWACSVCGKASGAEDEALYS